MSKNVDKNDLELMKCYQTGDEGAFMEIYNRYSPKIYGYLQSKVYNKSHIPDIYQAVFLKFHKSKMQYNDKYPLEAWIFTITRSLFIDYCRKEKSLEQNQILTNEENETDYKESNVNDILVNLDKKNSDILKMRYLDEKSFEEIAEILTTTPSNVRKIVSRAIQTLRLKMGGTHE
ncbi:MAG: sigma-70 family RNA polymerase sigma factor [Bacteriovoracaceae bacterium]